MCLEQIKRNSNTGMPITAAMPRKPRFCPPGTVQHFISRIVNGEFRIRGPAERSELSRRFGESIVRTDWRALASVWMDNHEHIATVAGHEEAWRFLKPTHTAFGNWLNRRDRRFGHVYAGRPKNLTFRDEESVACLLAYIHNNPVRAGVVSDPLDSAWSSHRAYVGEAPTPMWLDVELGLSLAGFSATGNGRVNFHDFVRSRSGLPRDPKMTCDDTPSSTKLREALGSSVEAVPVVESNEHKRLELLVRHGTNLEARLRVDPDVMLHVVAMFTKVPITLICGRTRARDVVAARRLALIAWERLLGQTVADLAAVLNISPQACGQLLARDAAVLPLMDSARAVANEVSRISRTLAQGVAA